jgi:hypothetical protein
MVYQVCSQAALVARAAEGAAKLAAFGGVRRCNTLSDTTPLE